MMHAFEACFGTAIGVFGIRTPLRRWGKDRSKGTFVAPYTADRAFEAPRRISAKSASGYRHFRPAG